FALEHRHELALAARVLEVEAAEDAAARGGDVVLDEGAGDAGGGVAGGVEGFEEEAAGVAEDFGLEEEEAGGGEGGDVHERLWGGVVFQPNLRHFGPAS